MLRDAIADQLNSAVGGVIDTIAEGIWPPRWLLRSVFELVDSFTTLNVVSVDGGIDPTSDRHDLAADALVSLVIATGCSSCSSPPPCCAAAAGCSGSRPAPWPTP